MGRHAVAQVEIDLVHIAPAPTFRGIIAFDDRMRRRMEMLGGMPIGGLIAAADMAACPAEPQMHPPGTRLQAFLAAIRARTDVLDRMKMRAWIGHSASVNQAVSASSSTLANISL